MTKRRRYLMNQYSVPISNLLLLLQDNNSVEFLGTFSIIKIISRLHLVLFAGPPGVGKTRLMKFLQTFLCRKEIPETEEHPIFQKRRREMFAGNLGILCFRKLKISILGKYNCEGNIPTSNSHFN
jgi:hypothetical protein